VQHRVRDTRDAEEIVQGALITILKGYRTISFDTNFSAWAYRVLVNEILNFRRKKKREEARMEARESVDETAVGTAPEPLFERALLDCLQSIGRRNPRYARILNLKYQGWSVAEICEKLGLSANALYVTLSRARTALLECLGDEEDNQ
jgi:RNA polymerase sigma-70 factor (ECF subfamily)